MCIIITQNYTMAIKKLIVVNTRLFQMLKKELGNKYNAIRICRFI